MRKSCGITTRDYVKIRLAEIAAMKVKVGAKTLRPRYWTRSVPSERKA